MTDTGEKLNVTLPDDTRILMTRRLAARRDRVFHAWTTPELVKRWWSGGHGTVTVAEIDLRVGGAWRYVLKTDDGTEVGFHGEYREVVPAERIVYTEVYEQAGGDETDAPVTTVTFAEADGGTEVSLLVECANTQLRDLILNSGMEVGVREQFVAIERIAAAG